MRFALLVAAVALLVFLILTQQALQNGLITSFVGAIKRQSAPVLVFAVDGQRTLQGSVITPPLQKAIEGVPGVAEAGRIGQGTFTVVVGRRRTVERGADRVREASARRARPAELRANARCSRARRWGARGTSRWAIASASWAPARPSS